MKTKFMMLLAAMLLSASAFAQSENNEPLKGDVNGDGKVDVADINEIIKIMKDAGGTAEPTTYYWYVGTTAINPSNYKTVANQVTTIPSTTTIRLNEQQLFIVAPSDKIVTALTSDGDGINLNTYDPSTGTFTRTYTTLGDGYTLYASRGTSINDSGAVINVETQTTYYWYVGTTKPRSVNGAVNNPATDKWTSLGTTKPTQILIESESDWNFPNWYVAIPTSFNFQPYDMTGAELDLGAWDDTVDTTTINGYSIWKLANENSSFISMFK